MTVSVPTPVTMPEAAPGGGGRGGRGEEGRQERDGEAGGVAGGVRVPGRHGRGPGLVFVLDGVVVDDGERATAGDDAEGRPRVGVPVDAATVGRKIDVRGHDVELAAAPGLGNDDLHRSSEERRVGKACVSTCRSRWSPYP